MDYRLKALVFMQMRYQVPRARAIEMGEAWLQANNGQTWATLTESLKSSQVTVVEDQLVHMVNSITTSPQPIQTQEIKPTQSAMSQAIIVMRMRYKIPRTQAIEMGEAWLQANIGQTWTNLAEFLKSSQVVLLGNQLVNTFDATT